MQVYMGLMDPETEDARRGIEATIPPGAVMVTGPQSTGTRLMCRILEAGGFTAWHDSKHGLVPRPVERVVAMEREIHATHASIYENFVPEDRIPIGMSLAGIRNSYPFAHRVNYDRLCLTPDWEIERLAAYLGVDPWPMPEPIIISHNTRRFTWRSF